MKTFVFHLCLFVFFKCSAAREKKLKINLAAEYKTLFFFFLLDQVRYVTGKPNHKKNTVESKALCLTLTL